MENWKGDTQGGEERRGEAEGKRNNSVVRYEEKMGREEGEIGR